MSVHSLLDDQIKSLQLLRDVDAKRKRLEQLPVLTKALDRTYQQALYLSHSIELMQQVFYQTPSLTQAEFQSYLQKPLEFLFAPDEVFTRDQEEIAGFQMSLEDCREQLQTLATRIDQQFTDFRRGLSQEMDSVRGLLKIPDLLPENVQAEQVEEILNEMDKVLTSSRSTFRLLVKLKVDSTSTLQPSADKWKQLYSTFTAIREQLSFDRLREPPYEFDERTIRVVKDLVSGQTLTLDQLLPLTVGELHRNFKHFLSQVELRFTAQEKGGQSGSASAS